MHVHFSFEHETWRNDTGYRILSNLTGNWKFQRLSLITWKHLMSSFNLLHINFIYFPAGIWDTTRSRSSRQGYFQIYFPCKHSKWKKGYFFDYSFIWLTSKEPKTSFGACELWGGGGERLVLRGFIVWPRFQLSFLKSMKSLFRPQSFECIKLSQKKPFLD